MKVLMLPGYGQEGDRTTGISAVVHKYVEYLPKLFGVQFVTENPDVIVAHAGISGKACDVSVLHGMYWTGDYDASKAEYAVNAKIADSVRSARQVTVPSEWVKKTLERDMRIQPHVIPHGIEWGEWQGVKETSDYILWNKNRLDRICDPSAMQELSKISRQYKFLTTFALGTYEKNVKVIGKQSFDKMKAIVQKAWVYLSLTKETFGIGTLEALASGVPVLGWDFGGNKDLVQHCVNGYLAEPFNYDDLEYGLEYCIKYRKVLSGNARELAKRWKWEDAVSKLYDVITLANKPVERNVSVIIPTYNYADRLERAVSSVCNQTLKPHEVVIVDDGSKDNPAVAVKELSDKYPDVDIKLIRQKNSGVAIARNTGVKNSTGEYICCLDPDDKIEPLFLEACVDALEGQSDLYTAYTRLKYIKPDGETGISEWPREYDFDHQLQRRNQVPTCNVAKRCVWERLGGQRSRYAPKGAGSEDAEMWTRAGAHGMRAELVSNKPLFVYSWLSGMVSGNKEYREVDWLGRHPWVVDKIHPFASLASPENKISHPVFQYDEIVVSIVIPVGERHKETVVDTLDSIEAQSFRRWEIVVVDNTVNGINDFIKNAYPFITWVRLVDDSHSPGKARNLGAENVNSNLLLFLDADDEFSEADSLKKILDKHYATGDIIYTDYVIKMPRDADAKKKYGERFLKYDENTNEVYVVGKSLEYNCEKAQKDLGYNWCIVSCLVPLDIHKSVNGFDESMSLLEDVDYYKRIAKAGHCFSRLDEPLFLIDRTRPDSKKTEKKLVDAKIKLGKKLERIKDMACNGCGNRAVSRELADAYNSAYKQITNTRKLEMSEHTDGDFVRCEYMSRMVGDHLVTGTETGINYGYRGRGDIFLVHKKDIATGLFKPLESQEAKVLHKKVVEEPAPQSVIESNKPKQRMVESLTVELLSELGIKRNTENVLIALKEMDVKFVGQIPALLESQLTEINGVGTTTAKALKKNALEYIDG